MGEIVVFHLVFCGRRVMRLRNPGDENVARVSILFMIRQFDAASGRREFTVLLTVRLTTGTWVCDGGVPRLPDIWLCLCSCVVFFICSFPPSTFFLHFFSSYPFSQGPRWVTSEHAPHTAAKVLRVFTDAAETLLSLSL